ncbi:MAG: 5-methyltetrahydropteroyltriglutamate--homocysteine methyltransferase [Gammaproteobacteria bacterium]|nr:5-methyltetrahydropteroyltriglutamate--homocysteine methyltransferase [Gammaproteobacteria bacterium]
MVLPLIPTTLVGSYPQPDWLVDKTILIGNSPPRVRMRKVWRFEGELLGRAQDDAALLVLRDMERAGLDIVGDGEVRRESYFNRFATALSGVDLDSPGIRSDRIGNPTPVPRVVGPVRRLAPVELDAVRFLRAQTDLPIKVTLPGPFTMTQLAQDEYYGDDGSLASAYADAVRAEIVDLAAAGVDYIQLDEPYLQAQPDAARRFGVEAIDRALYGCPVPSIVHVCFGYAYVVSCKPNGYSFLGGLDRCCATQISIEAAQPQLDLAVLRDLPSKVMMVGVLDLADPAVEDPETVSARIRAALVHLPPERLVVAPDCGMKYLAREVAFGKMRSLVQAARTVRRELD